MGGELHCRAVSFCFQARTFCCISRGHERRTASGLVEGQRVRRKIPRRRAARPAARTARLLPNARAAPASVELHCRAVSFVFKCGVRCISRGHERRTASGLTGEQRGRRKIPRRRAGGPAAWTARLMPSAQATPESVELHCRAVSFVFKRGRSLNLTQTRAAHG